MEITDFGGGTNCSCDIFFASFFLRTWNQNCFCFHAGKFSSVAPIKWEQLTVCFHVDDCKISHLILKVVDETIEWLRYEHVFEDGTGEMKVHCGKTHKYLGMSLDFGHVNQCRITMIDYVDVIIAAYDKALGELDDGFSAVKKRSNPARTSAAPSSRRSICCGQGCREAE